MSLESDIFSALTSLASGRIYPDVAPNGATRPFVVYQQVGGQAFAFLENAAVGKRNASVQVSCWAATRAAANTLARSAEDAMVASAALRARPIGAFVAVFDEDTKLYGCQQDFSIFY